jgi:hypothetical protein
MATFNKFNAYVADLHHGKHDFSAHSFKVELTNTAPVVTNAVKADITDIAAGNGYTAGGSALSLNSEGQISGTYKAIFADLTFTASGGSIGPFRYAVLYNDTTSSPAKPLIGWWDYGTGQTITAGNSFLVDLDQVAGVLQST